MKKTSFIIITWICLGFLIGASAGNRLAFKDGRFKILQLTDIHWDPKSDNCAKTIASIKAVIEAERPDAAMLTGDIVTAQPGEQGWESIIALMEEAQLPFTVMMGNHDAEILPKDAIYTRLSRSAYFIGEKGPDDIQGMGNCVIPVYGLDDKPAALLYCLDSNDYPELKDYGTYDWIHFNQIAWYRSQSTQYTANNGGKPLPALAFFHIPVPEYKLIREAETTFGNREEGGSGSPMINTGFFASLIEMGDVMATFVGHDHDNDYIGLHYGKALAYGRVGGWDAYGQFERGGRIIELREGTFAFDTWIRTPKGREHAFYYPSGLTSHDEETMTYLPAKDVKPTEQGVTYTYYEGNFKHTADLASATPVRQGKANTFTIADAPIEDHFGYDFHTLIHIPERGVYRFYTYSDDGSKLLIDGQEVVDNDGGHSAHIAKGKVALEAGYHEMQVLYFEDYMGNTLEVGISSRTIPETVLPEEMLYQPVE